MGSDRHHRRAALVKIFLCGDVMTARGIDQALPHPCSPVLHESYVDSAIDYLRLAERANGRVPRPVDFAYVWGAALDEWLSARPHARIVNLETSITDSEAFEPKGINYRMSPQNALCLTAAALDCCVLANNHVLDWGLDGLLDTLNTLERLHIKTAGAGRNLAEAKAPAVIEVPDEGRLLVLALASETSGAPRHWAADAGKAGVNLLSSLSEATVDSIVNELAEIRRPRDVIVVSIHWGPNWGYPIPKDQRRFAHALIDEADVSIVHGHSSHHAKAIEVYENRLILYGCGDFLNDYEGIAGYEEFRGDLSLMYFADVHPADGRLGALDITPLQIRRFQLSRPSQEDVDWLRRTLDRESAPFGTRVGLAPGRRLTVS
jgi:poly-gamma-glutamate capsule biosynthesis protein CapA/YwtB (metallophosphatase superfamily)